MSIAGKIKKTLGGIKRRKKKRWEPQEGDNLVRILPWADDEPFYLETWEHFVPWGGRNGRGWAYLCTGDDCVGCAASAKMQESKKADIQEKGARTERRPRYYMILVDMNKPEFGPQVWATGSDRLLNDLAGLYGDPDIGEFWHPKTGRNIIIHMEKPKGGPPRYTCRPKTNASRIESRAWLGKIDLKKFVTKANPTELAQVLGVEAGEADPAIDYPCFGISYKKPKLYRMRKYGKKVPECADCPVRIKCKRVWRERKIARERKRARSVA